MKRLLASFLFLILCSSGCIARERVNANCEWTHDAAFPLDLQNRTDRQHLVDDTEVAEDLAIRHADSLRRIQKDDLYVGTRDECRANLFKAIASNHDVSSQQIQQSLGRRRASFDLAVILPFVVLYGLVASFVARKIVRRLHSQPWLALTATLATSIAVSTAGVLLGEIWSGIAEGLRLGNAHMSYRASRIPWSHHRVELFIGGLVVFWLIALLRHRIQTDSSDSLFDVHATSLGRTITHPPFLRGSAVQSLDAVHDLDEQAVRR